MNEAMNRYEYSEVKTTSEENTKWNEQTENARAYDTANDWLCQTAPCMGHIFMGLNGNSFNLFLFSATECSFSACGFLFV